MPEVGRIAEELRGCLAEVEPGRYSGAACADIAEELARTEKACAVARVRFAARAAECGEHTKRGFADASAWLASTAGSSMGQARAQLDTLKRVEDCPATKDALVDSAVSLEQAAEIVSVPGHEAELLGLAERSGSGAVKRQARKRRLEGLDVEALHAARHRAREFVHSKDRLGMVRFHGALPPEIGMPLVNRLDHDTDRLWRRARYDGRGEPRATLAADAFAAMLPGADTRAKNDAKQGDTKRADGTWRADIVFCVDVRAYARGHAHPGETCKILDGGPVPVSVVRDHAAEAFVKAVVHDGTEVESIVHYGRPRPALLRSVLELGDPPDFDGVACAEQGCERRYGLEWDHDDPVANGGPTAKENLVARCRPHHREKTARDRRAGTLRGKRERAP